MAIEVNGVTLPDIPEVEGYPYSILANDGEEFICFTTTEPLFYYADINELVTKNIAAFVIYSCTNGAWEKVLDVPAVDKPSADLNSTPMVWSNHDILNADTGEIYFPSSVAEPEYGKIRRQYMRDIGDAIRRKTGKTDKMPPEQMASEIDSVVTADGMPNAETGAAFGTDESNGNQYGISSFTNGSIFNSNGNSYSGYKFTVNKPICLVGFSFLAQGSADIMKMRLWDDENKVEVISLNVKASSTGSMQDGLLESPIVLEVGKSYIVTMTGKDDSAYRYWNFETRTSSEKITIVAPVYGFPPNYPTVSSNSTGKINGVDIIFTDVPDEVEITEYKIQTETLTIMADEIKRIKGLTGVLTVEGMISALEGM